MVTHIEAEREEYVVPYEHLHLGLFAGVDGHHITVDHGHRAAGRSCHEVTVHLCVTNVFEFVLKSYKPGFGLTIMSNIHF